MPLAGLTKFADAFSGAASHWEMTHQRAFRVIGAKNQGVVRHPVPHREDDQALQQVHCRPPIVEAEVTNDNVRCLWSGFVKAVVLARSCRPLLSYECPKIFVNLLCIASTPPSAAGAKHKMASAEAL